MISKGCGLSFPCLVPGSDHIVYGYMCMDMCMLLYQVGTSITIISSWSKSRMFGLSIVHVVTPAFTAGEQVQTRPQHGNLQSC